MMKLFTAAALAFAATVSGNRVFEEIFSETSCVTRTQENAYAVNECRTTRVDGTTIAIIYPSCGNNIPYEVYLGNRCDGIRLESGTIRPGRCDTLDEASGTGVIYFCGADDDSALDSKPQSMPVKLNPDMYNRIADKLAVLRKDLE